MTATRFETWTPGDPTLPMPAPRQLGRWELLRCKLAARITRLFRWEFWPAWAIYLPLAPYIALLALRHSGLSTCTLANPGIPLGGIVGESKGDILTLLPREAIVPTALIEPAPLPQRMEMLAAVVRDQCWSWPIILKPDVGERGTGVRLVHNADEAHQYLHEQSEAIIAQAYHPGPYEAGVFYIRLPGESSGHIFSITDKRFASVTGDGRSSLRTLIWRHPRYRVQASVFLASLADGGDRIPNAGEVVKLGFMGNHCRGSMFLDGASLITGELTAAIDAIAAATPGFYFGRFDVRYSSIKALMAGQDFRIVELNGLLSESTNIYDPSMSFFRAQGILRRQWRWAYRIGHAIHERGTPRPALAEIIAAWRTHTRRVR